MKKMVKQVVGIDVAQKELVVCLGRMYDDWSPELYSSKNFANNAKGFEALVSWVKKMTDPQVSIRYVMEATGIYHESLCYYLADKGYALSVVLPNKISNYFRTLAVKTITDKTASEAIALFGLERKLDDWKRPEPVYKKLKQLTREREQLVQIRTMAKNQLHAEQSEAEPNKSSIARVQKQIAFLNKQEQEIKAELQELVKQNDQLKSTVKTIGSLPGVG